MDQNIMVQITVLIQGGAVVIIPSLGVLGVFFIAHRVGWHRRKRGMRSRRP
jgi:hypothetical protein